MNYDLPLSEDISKVVFSMGRFDAGFAGDMRSLNRLTEYLRTQCHARSLKVCIEQFKGDESVKAYDRGYIKGIYETLSFILKSYEAGEKLTYPDEQAEVKGPRIV